MAGDGDAATSIEQRISDLEARIAQAERQQMALTDETVLYLYDASGTAHYPIAAMVSLSSALVKVGPGTLATYDLAAVSATGPRALATFYESADCSGIPYACGLRGGYIYGGEFELFETGIEAGVPGVFRAAAPASAPTLQARSARYPGGGYDCMTLHSAQLNTSCYTIQPVSDAAQYYFQGPLYVGPAPE
ncbi:MAG: hypothetical protein D6761_12515 [Candidatus Dadabacteria bacterium]|nr:MAG: hypothetical protein D6761_12515 [Candidatus Dadabacteria bacterium]